MTHDLATLAQEAIHLFQTNQPWLQDKFGAALITQTIRELWEQTKTKLGSTATAKVEQEPNDTTGWELLKSRLLVAMADDEAFREKIKSLTQSASHTSNQTASGNIINQVAVVGSQDVKINTR